MQGDSRETTSASEIAQALTAAVRELDAAQDAETALRAVTSSAVISLPGIDHAGVLLMRVNGSIETKGGTSDLPQKLDALQYEVKEGPCYDAAVPDNPDVLVANQIRHDQRWPQYVPRAVQLGLRAQVGIRLFNRDGILGALNLYATESDEIPDETVDAAQLFAANAAVILARVGLEANLRAAMETRTAIGVATGLVMAKYGVTQEQAFQYLTRLSQTSNTKLRVVADSIVADRLDTDA
ncbi:MAG: GAF and ANTAR domain-containing protein [Marmoricola sp.]